jgi:proteic killer suppression protein
MGIRNCRNKGLEELYVRGKSRHIGARYQANILRILDHLAAITDLKDCEGVKDFHELKGERKGTFSMHVTGNYCITFKWNGTDVYDVDFEDYH